MTPVPCFFGGSPQICFIQNAGVRIGLWMEPVFKSNADLSTPKSVFYLLYAKVLTLDSELNFLSLSLLKMLKEGMYI